MKTFFTKRSVKFMPVFKNLISGSFVFLLFSSITATTRGQCIITGPLQATNIENDASVGTLAFLNPMYAQFPDNNRAIATITASLLNTSTNYLKATDFNILIPGTAIICGIVVEIEKSATGIGILTSVSDGVIKLVKDGIITGDNKAESGILWPASDTYFTYGSNTDLWNTTISANDVNTNKIGVVLSADIVGILSLLPSARVNDIRMTVYYIAPLLPITLSLLEATKKNGNKIHFKWLVQNEEDVSKYILEQSANSTDWYNIYETLPAITNPSGKYDVELSANGFIKNYYRLRILSKNGNIQFSPVKMIANDPGKSFQIVMGPGNNKIYINNSGAAGHAFIIDLQGRLVTQKTISAGISNEVDISALTKGVYLLKIGNTTQRFIKM